MNRVRDKKLNPTTKHNNKFSSNFLLNKLFQFDKRNAILRKEIIGGISTFLAMAYILAVNPSLVGNAPVFDSTSVTHASAYSGGLFLATAISSFIGTLLMGLFANIPIALAPGMGLNAFFAFTVAQGIGFSSALTVTILSGILYFIIVVTPLRSKISKLIPNNIKLAIGVAIGFFVAYLGLQNSGIIVVGNGTVSGLGDFTNPLVILAIVMIFVSLVLHYLKVPAAILISLVIGAVILLGIVGGNHVVGYTINDMLGSYDNFSTFKDVIVAGWNGFANVEMWKNPLTYISVLSFVYMDFFDTTGTLILLSKTTEVNKHDKKWMVKANIVDAVSTIGGASIGATTVTSFVESTVGVSAGAKTGLANIFTALLFALSIAAWPILQVFMPINNIQPITGPILVLIGTLMISQIRHFNWKITIDIPMLFMTIIFMMLTNSIADGIGFGTLTFIILNFSAGCVSYINRKSKSTNDLEITLGETKSIKKEDINYFKRINWMLIFIACFFIVYIVVTTFI